MECYALLKFTVTSPLGGDKVAACYARSAR